jgi:hypothetical protein
MEIYKKILFANFMAFLTIMLYFISIGIPRSTFDTYEYNYIEHSTTTPLSNEATITKKDFNLTYVKWISFWKLEGSTYGSLGIHYNITFLWNNPFGFNVSADIETSYNPQNGASYSVQHGVYVNGTQLNRSSLINVQPLETIKIDYYDAVEWFNLESLNDTETLNRELKVSEEGIIEGAQLRFIFPKENWQTVLTKYPQSFSTKTDTWTETEKVYLGCLFHPEIFIEFLKNGLLYSVIVIAMIWLSAFIYFQIKTFYNWAKS